MSQVLNLELSEPTFTAIRQQAKLQGISPESLVASLVEQQFAQALNLPDETEHPAARSRFERHFGMLNVAATRVDNESIDADLTTEYAAHEDRFVRLS